MMYHLQANRHLIPWQLCRELEMKTFTASTALQEMGAVAEYAAQRDKRYRIWAVTKRY